MRVRLRSLLKRLSPASGFGLAVILFLASCSQEQLDPRATLAIGVDPISGASIETNQDNYVPGEIVHLALKGWAANEEVRLFMSEDPDTHGDVDTTVTVDENGEWNGHFYDVQDHDFGVTFTLTGTGLTSGFSVTVQFVDGHTFTDATINGVSIDVNDVTVAPGAALAITATANTVCTGNPNNCPPNASSSTTDDWQATKVTVKKKGGGSFPLITLFSCESATINITTATTGAVQTFPSVLAPSDPGDYEVEFTAYTDNSCANSAGAKSFGKSLKIVAPTTGSIDLVKAWVGVGSQTTLKLGTSIGGSEVKLQVTGAAGAAPLSTTPQSVTPATYYVSETGGLTDYTSSLACTKNGSNYVPLANDGVAVAANDVVVCTFTNSQKPQLKVVKATVPTTDLGKFDFTIAGTTHNNSNAGYGNGEETAFVSLDPGTISISEAGHTGTTLGDYSSALACNSGKTVGSNTGVSGTVELNSGDVVTCTFTNSRKPQLKLAKATVPITDLGKFDLTIAATTHNNTGAGYGNGQETALVTLDPGTISISEAAHSGTTIGDYSASLACDSGKTVGSDLGISGTVTLAYGDVVTCTFTNSRKPQIKVAKATVPTGAGGKFDFTIGVTSLDNGGTGYGNGEETAFVTVVTGDVAISEAGHTGTSLSDYSSQLACVGKAVDPNTGISGTVKNMAYGDKITCTFTNSLKPKLKVVKATVPPGDLGKFDFTIAGTPHNNSGAGYGNTQGTDFITLDAGNTDLSEAGHTGTSLTDYTPELACDDGENEKAVASNTGSSGTVNLVYGDEITCTFTNTRNASLDIEKVTVGDEGEFDFVASGSGVPTPFSRTTTSIGVATVSDSFVIAKANFGTKYVTETPPAGWEITDIVCHANGAAVVVGHKIGGVFQNGGSDQYDTGDDRVKVTVDAGDTPTCTFQNTKAASLDIEKVSKDDVGTFNYAGTGLLPFSRTTTAEDDTTTSDPITIGVANFGLKYVEETVPTGWAVTNIECTQNGAVIRIGHGSGVGFVPGATNDWDEGDNSVEANIGSGDEPVCTFTNRLKPKLTVSKATVPATDAGKFDFTVASTVHTNSGSGYGNGQSASSIILDPGAVTLSEDGHSPTDLADYVPALACVGKAVSSNTGSSGSITLDYGDDITCTFTNTRKGSITIKKNADPDNAQDFSFTATGTGMTPASFTLDDDGETINSPNQQKFSRLVPGAVGGTRTVTEAGGTGWTVIDIACYGATSSTVQIGSDADFDAGDTSVSIEVAAGENITCTFKNGVADLTVAKSHTGNFVFGTNGSYSIIVTNSGTAPTIGTVTITDVLPALLDYVSATGPAGSGWTCGYDTPTRTVTCTRSAVILAGPAAAPTITLTVSPTGAGSATNKATVLGGGEIKTDNNESSDLTTIDAAPTTTVASVETASLQYSDEATLKATITPHTIGTSELTGTVYFYLRSAPAVSCGSSAPAIGTYDASDNITAAENGVAQVDYPVPLQEGSTYVLTACFYPLNPDFAKSGDDQIDVAVGKEDALVGPTSPPSATAFPVASGQTTTTVIMTFLVREKNPEPDANAGALPGDVDNTGLEVDLLAVGAVGNNQLDKVCTSPLIATPPAYADAKTYTCTFTNVAIDAYEVLATVTGNYYVGSYDDAITIYDPAAGFVTGGGRIELPGATAGSTERVNFGLVFNYTGKGKTAPKGNLVVIRHLSNGDVCRGKSNAIDAPAVSGKTAGFSGKGNYGCTRPNGTTYNGVGNQTLTGWVEDNGQGSSATGPDRFWISIPAPLSVLKMDPTGSANAKPLLGGNIQVPQPGGAKP